MAKDITPRDQDYARWYTDVVTRSTLADYSPVKGCMVIRPHGTALWENMQRGLDGMFKATGHENAYFPLFIPKSFLAREAEHVEGFAKECAIVTHTRLKATEIDGRRTVVPDPDSRLEEELIVRPTSETIIYSMFARWIQSWRDLPILLNQWANVVRWEMRTRLFLRTTEFLWQEGHTAHATHEEAIDEARRMLEVYRTFAEEWLAIPVLTGTKTDSEKFAGALTTYCIEALMQDGKALQAGTSHDLGQNFARAFDVKYQDASGRWEHVWNTSWGVSTRLIGALVMCHGDDDGLVLPPRVAPVQVAIVPIWRSDAQRETVLAEGRALRDRLAARGLSVRLDERDNVNPGFKFADWELKGVPLRLELGPRDVESRQVVAVSRLDRTKTPCAWDGLEDAVASLLDRLQAELLDRARERRDAATRDVETRDEFVEALADGGFVRARFVPDAEVEAQIQQETKATVRLIPFDEPDDPGPCVWTGRPAQRRAVFARAY
ncbi:MAG: proline--tRNA ligase [Acidobacteria bacterium]|nr:MAG: proline--tRNA ligase [Acidobacteriota bacterium]